MPVMPPQPPIPPRRPAGQGQPPPPKGHFSVVGVDRVTNRAVSTVIEARDDDEGRALAEQKGIVVQQFMPMHPLAGAAALKMARDDPNDRFNHHPGHEPSEEEAAAAFIDELENAGRPHIDPLPQGFNSRAAFREQQQAYATTASPPSGALGWLSAAAIVVAAFGLLYFTVLKDDGLEHLAAVFKPQPIQAQTVPLIEEPHQQTATAEAAVAKLQPQNGNTLKLQATAPPTRNTAGSAVISEQIVQRGQTIGGYRLVQINDGWVVLQRNGKLVALRIASDKPTRLTR